MSDESSSSEACGPRSPGQGHDPFLHLGNLVMSGESLAHPLDPDVGLSPHQTKKKKDQDRYLAVLDLDPDPADDHPGHGQRRLFVR